MITGINESRTLTKHISCECKCKFDGRKCNSNQKWNKGEYESPKDIIIWKRLCFFPSHFDEKKATCKTQNFYILLAFLLR